MKCGMEERCVAPADALNDGGAGANPLFDCNRHSSGPILGLKVDNSDKSDAMLTLVAITAVQNVCLVMVSTTCSVSSDTLTKIHLDLSSQSGKNRVKRQNPC